MGDKIHCAGTDKNGQTLYMFECPGCGYSHGYYVPRWKWNNSFERPTFTPSLLCNGHDAKTRCHLFVEDGRIRFLNDCWHALRGKTVDMLDWERGYEPKIQN